MRCESILGGEALGMDILKKHRQRRRERIQELYERHKRIRALLKEHGADILSSENFKGTRRHIQHGNMTVHSHVINVARYSLLINRKLRIGCNKHDLIRGALCMIISSTIGMIRSIFRKGSGCMGFGIRESRCEMRRKNMN